MYTDPPTHKLEVDWVRLANATELEPDHFTGRQSSGDTISEVPVGSYVVSYSELAE